jgi:hypothetical protein
MLRVICVIAALSLAACGGGGGSAPALSDTPVLYLAGTATVVPTPLTFTAGQSVQFAPQEAGGYQGSFTIATLSGTAGDACITMSPAAVSNGAAFTASTGSPACSSYPQSETYAVSDVYGHSTTVTIQINAP